MIFRHDDFDFRENLETVKKIHEEYIKRDLVETIAVNNSIGGGVGWKPEVLDYVNSTSNWDIQLHGWMHEPYEHYPYWRVFGDLVATLSHTKQYFPNSDPKIFYAPWNGYSGTIEKACADLGIQMGGVGDYIMHYLDWGRRGKDIIYYHSWDSQDVANVPKLLDTFIKEKEVQDAKTAANEAR